MWNVQIPLSHPKDVTTQSNRVRRKVLKSFHVEYSMSFWFCNYLVLFSLSDSLLCSKPTVSNPIMQIQSSWHLQAYFAEIWLGLCRMSQQILQNVAKYQTWWMFAIHLKTFEFLFFTLQVFRFILEDEAVYLKL